uniref:Uncharacterized protein n=1 Tax=Rhizophora mucronata TaxID=61149 RepID=A0A2P2QCM8_RHIMU
MNRTACNTLLSWGVSHIFKKLDDLHGCITSIPASNLFSEWSRLDGVLCELLALLPFNTKPIPSDDSYISKVEQSGGAYVRNISLLGEKEIESTETEDPVLFWKYLLEARHPQWYFLPESSPGFRRKLKFFSSFPKESKLGNNAGSCKGFNKQLNPIHLRSRSKCR